MPMTNSNQTVSIICVYNNREQLDDMLVKSLININIGGGVKKLFIDNISNNYPSCANAYNTELRKHRNELGEILIFLHQDIAFDDNIWLERIVRELADNPNQILGFAGMPKAGRTISNMRYLKTKQLITRTQLKEKTEVESLDECCFAMTKKIYNKVRFDEETCSHWHLYAVDFCYEARRKIELKSYVIPELIYHKYDGTSGLSTDLHFLKTLWKITKKYRKNYSFIFTPCYIISTSPVKALAKLTKSAIKNLTKQAN